MEPLIDNVARSETPLGVEISLHPAGLPVRGLAFFIDLIVRITLVSCVLYVMSYFGEIGGGISLITIFFVDWFYFVLWDVLNNGKSLGKMAMQIRTVQEDGTSINLGRSMIRTILLVVDFLPVLWVGGIVSIACTKRFSRLGDLAAGTMVVHDSPTERQETKYVVSPKKINVRLVPEERSNFLAFQDRLETFSPERQIELSEVLFPLTQQRGYASVSEVLKIAQGIRSSS